MKAFQLYMIGLFCWNTAVTQPFPNIRFSYLTEKEGLSKNEVSDITQDEQGFIWIGTTDGLNRFDGYRVKHFFHNPSNDNSLANNSVYRVVPDRHDHLWISTREGLSFYDKKTGVFRNFRHNPSDTFSLDNDGYASIFVNRDHSAWVSTQSAVYHFIDSSHYRKIATGIGALKDDEKRIVASYKGLTLDHQGNLWACMYGYVFRLDQKTMKVTKTYGPFKGNLQFIFQDSNNQFWIGSFGGGLMAFDPGTGLVTSLDLTSQNNIIFSITEWRDKNHYRWLVLGSDHGLILLDPLTLHFKEYTFHLGFFPQQVLTKNGVQRVFVDRQNILWLGTEAGVCYAEPSRQLFDLWNISDAAHEFPITVSDWVYSICEFNHGYWMTRWQAARLYYLDSLGNLVTSIHTIHSGGKTYSLTDSLKPYFVRNEGDSAIWFTTDEFLGHLNLRSNKCELYKPPDGNPVTGLRTILVKDSHDWWIRTRNNGSNGIYVFDPVNRKFKKHYSGSIVCDSCLPSELLTMYLTREKEIYVTAVGKGLYRFDEVSDQFKPVFRFQGNNLKQHSNSFESLVEDKDGLLWIATYTGLFTFNPSTGKVICDYSDNELLGGVEVTGVVLDEHQNAWLNTIRGIYFIMHSNGEVHPLSYTQGFTNNSNGVFLAGSDHSIFNGVEGYILRLHPSEILSNPPKDPPVQFSEATVMDAPYYLHQDASGEKEMIVEPGQNRFTLDFSVMNYDGKNHYYYQLEGLMDDWPENENGHLAFYNLSPGKYTLRVRGNIGSEDRSFPEDSVVIVVKPHWWQTNGFRLLALLLMLSLIIYLVRRRILQIRHEASFKQKIAETEMMALRSQMNPHFIFNSLNSIENFIMQSEKLLASNYMNKFARLMRTILDSSRNELVPLSKDIEALRLYVDLEQLRFNHKFCFDLEVDSNLLHEDYKVPALLIQPYVENAIVHGLAHSEKEQLNLMVNISLEGEYIHYRIQDNGIGRELASRYNRQNHPQHKSVGLKITEQRIQIFNRKYGSHGRVTITDLFDCKKQPAGTKVEVLIKTI